MQKCSFPLCQRYGNSNYCLFHEKVYGNGATKTKDQAIIPIPQLTEKAQNVVNAFIRNRDKSLGCITCGAQVEDAGHYIPVGENSALRFEEDNIAGQCKKCNCHEYGNRAKFREALIQRIGLDRVKELESTAKFHKWSREQLNNIISAYSVDKKAVA